jgi:DNA-directed RNA polymerase subunit RPC12/RpoP
MTDERERDEQPRLETIREHLAALDVTDVDAEAVDRLLEEWDVGEDEQPSRADVRIALTELGERQDPTRCPHCGSYEGVMQTMENCDVTIVWTPDGDDWTQGAAVLGDGWTEYSCVSCHRSVQFSYPGGISREED